MVHELIIFKHKFENCSCVLYTACNVIMNGITFRKDHCSTIIIVKQHIPDKQLKINF